MTDVHSHLLHSNTERKTPNTTLISWAVKQLMFNVISLQAISGLLKLLIILQIWGNNNNNNSILFITTTKQICFSTLYCLITLNLHFPLMTMVKALNCFCWCFCYDLIWGKCLLLIEWDSCNHLWLDTTFIISTLDLEEPWKIIINHSVRLFTSHHPNKMIINFPCN